MLFWTKHPNGTLDSMAEHRHLSAVQGVQWTAIASGHIQPIKVLGSCTASGDGMPVVQSIGCYLLEPALHAAFLADSWHVTARFVFVHSALQQELMMMMMQAALRYCTMLLYCASQKSSYAVDSGTAHMSAVAEARAAAGHCVDDSPQCAAWAAAGECQNNPSYMSSAARDKALCLVVYSLCEAWLSPPVHSAIAVLLRSRQPRAQLAAWRGLARAARHAGCATTARAKGLRRRRHGAGSATASARASCRSMWHDIAASRRDVTVCGQAAILHTSVEASEGEHWADYLTYHAQGVGA